MMFLSISLIGCLEVRNYYYKQSNLLAINTMIPNKSVFEPLTAKQIRKCYKLYPFDDFYSEYCPKILKCGHQEKVMFVDITWRSLFKYYLFSIEDDVYFDEFEDYQDKCADSWDNRYGRYEKEVDSLLTYWSKEARDYIHDNIESYVDVALADRRLAKKWSLDTLLLNFRLTTKAGPITKCRFKWQGMYFLVKGDVIDHTAICDFKIKNNPYPLMHSSVEYDGTIRCNEDEYYDSIRITDVSLLNGKEYSLHNLQIPELYKEYILWYVLSNSDGDREDARESFLKYYFNREHHMHYKKKSHYISERAESWERSRYSREIDFVEALNKIE